MNSTPAYWDGARWVVQSSLALSPGQLKRIGEWLRRVQAQRLASLRPGAKKDECKATIKALDEGRIVCGLTGGDLWKSTHGTGKIIVGA